MKQNLIGPLCALAVMGGAFAQTPNKPTAKPSTKAAVVIEEKDAATLEFEKFRAEMEQSNPAELFEMKGQEQWRSKRGPKNVSLAESCDLGQGVGKADADFVRAQTGFVIGGVAPLAHIAPPITLMDETLCNYASIWPAAGHPNTMFSISPQDLARVTGAQLADVAQEGTR